MGKYVLLFPAIVAGFLMLGVSNAYTSPNASYLQESELMITSDTLSQDQKEEPLYIVNGIRQAAENKRNYQPGEIEAVNVLKGDAAIAAYGDEGKNGVIEITTKDKSGTPPIPAEFENITIILDGKLISYKDFLYLSPNDLKQMSVYKGESAKKHFGEEVKDEVLEIITKRKD